MVSVHTLNCNFMMLNLKLNKDLNKLIKNVFQHFCHDRNYTPSPSIISILPNQWQHAFLQMYGMLEKLGF